MSGEIRAKDILPHKTSFGAGDGFYGDGPQSFFMEAETLLKLTAENALAGNLAPAFDPTRTEDDKYLAGESVVYEGKLFTFAVDHYGPFDSSKVFNDSMDNISFRSRLNNIVGTDDTEGYATVSGGHITTSAQTGCHYKKYDVGDVSGPIYLTAKRYSSSLDILIVFTADDGYTAVDLYRGNLCIDVKVDIPAGAKYAFVNHLDNFVSFVRYDATEFVDKIKDDVEYIYSKLDQSKVVYLTKTSGFVTADGNNNIVVSSQSGWSYGVFKIDDMVGADKVYINSHIKSSQFTAVARFADKNNKLIETVNSSVDDVVDLQAVIPSNAQYIYVNAHNNPDVSLKFTPDLYDNALKVNEELTGINGLAVSSSFSDSFSGIKNVSVYTNYSGQLYLKEFGYDAVNSKFVIKLANSDASKVFRAERPYNSRPSTNNDIVTFIASDSVFCYIEVFVNWTVYRNTYYESLSNDVAVEASKLSLMEKIRGEIYFDYAGYCVIPNGVSLCGQECAIKIKDKLGGFVLMPNAHLSGIVFIDNSNDPLVREEYSAAEIEEDPNKVYLFKPVIDVEDLSSEDENSLFGDSANFVIYFHEYAENASVENCTFKNFNRCALRDQGERHLNVRHNLVAGNVFDSCRTGVYCREEFTRISCNYFFGCVAGIIVHGSNFNAVNCIFVRCDCGMFFDSNQNAHGEVSTFEFAHNGIAGVYAKTVNDGVGFIFSNCQFAQADIIAESAYALKLSGCRLDCYIDLQSGAKNSIVGCNIRDNYALAAGHPTWISSPADTLLALNRCMNSTGNDSDYNNL